MDATSTPRLMKMWLKSEGHSLRTAAEVLDTSWRNVARWKNGENTPTAVTVEKIAPKMGLEPGDFYPGIEASQERFAWIEQRLDAMQSQLADLQRTAAPPDLAERMEQALAETAQALQQAGLADAPKRAAGGTRRAAKRSSAA